MYYITQEKWTAGNGFTVRLIARSNSKQAANSRAKTLHDNGVFPVLVVWGSDNDDARETARKVFARTLDPKQAMAPRIAA